MSKETVDNNGLEEAAFGQSAPEPLSIIVPSGALNTQTWSSQAWFYPYLPQTFAGAVSNGYAAPTVSGNGWMGQNNQGFVFQNGQYNSKREGYGA